MLDAVPKAAFSFLAGSPSLKRAASRYGMRRADSFARRFVAGETVDDAIEAARAIEASGLMVTMDLLGESVASAAQSQQATAAYISLVEQMAQAGVTRNISLKLTQLGLDVDRATCVDNLRRVLDRAQGDGFFVRIDMEGAAYTEQTLQIFETIWSIGYRNVGVVLQSYLMRTAADLPRMIALGARIRLVKGAYREPKEVALQKKTAVDAAYVDFLTPLLKDADHPAIATHDPVMIDAAKRAAEQAGRRKDQFEFQMLYGIRRDLQAQLHAEGYCVRIYVPFGREWFPYFMRRLGERPANVSFVLRSLLSER
jgi:proline dehydrogenase